jgi:hypothetical protein
MLCINVLDLVLLQSNLMLKQSSKFAGTLQEQRITVSLSYQKGISLSALWMLPMLGTGNNNLQWMIPQQLDHKLDTFCHLQNVLSFGAQNFRQRFPSQPPKLNTLPYHVQHERFYPFFHLQGRQLRRE